MKKKIEVAAIKVCIEKSPSRPSIQLKALDIPTTQKIVIKIPIIGLKVISPKPRRFPKLVE